MKRDYDGAIVALKEAIRLAPTEALHRRNMGYALLGKRDPDGAIAAFEEAIRRDPKHTPAHAGLGNADEAFAALEQAWLDRDPALAGVHVEPRFEPLRADARYRELLERLKLTTP